MIKDYAYSDFAATQTGQINVLAGDELQVLDENDAYWCLIKNLKTDEVGFIPHDRVENWNERLARLNGEKNILASAATLDEWEIPPKIPSRHGKCVKIKLDHQTIFVDYDLDDPRYESLVMGDMSQKSVSNNKPLKRSSTLPQKSNSGDVKPIVLPPRTASMVNKELPGQSSKVPKKPLIPSLDLPMGAREDPIAAPVIKSQDSRVGTPSQVLTVNYDLIDRSVTILNIYPANFDAPTVSLCVSKAITCQDLITKALEALNIRKESADHYTLSIAYMDSAAQKIKPLEVVHSILESMKSRRMPGVKFRQKVIESIAKDGKIKQVLTEEDLLFKILLKKEDHLASLALQASSPTCLRVFVNDGSIENGKAYRTISLVKGSRVSDAIAKAVLSFEIENIANEEFLLFASSGDLEEQLDGNLKIDELSKTQGKNLEFKLGIRQAPGDLVNPKSSKTTNSVNALNGPSLGVRPSLSTLMLSLGDLTNAEELKQDVSKIEPQVVQEKSSPSLESFFDSSLLDYLEASEGGMAHIPQSPTFAKVPESSSPKNHRFSLIMQSLNQFQSDKDDESSASTSLTENMTAENEPNPLELGLPNLNLGSPLALGTHLNNPDSTKVKLSEILEMFNFPYLLENARKELADLNGVSSDVAYLKECHNSTIKLDKDLDDFVSKIVHNTILSK